MPVVHHILNVLSVRAGFNSGYLTFGGKLCVDLVLVRLALEVTYFEEEVGDYAGNIGVDALLVSLTLGFL